MPALTRKQKQILRTLVLTGATNEELGKIHGITERAVKYHVGNLMEILGVNSRAQIQALALDRILGSVFRFEGEDELPNEPAKRVQEVAQLLSEIFEGDDSPLGQAFQKPLTSEEEG